MSEERAVRRACTDNLLQSHDNFATMAQEQPSMLADWLVLERMLLPLLNFARRKQGKKPVIVPKG